LRSPGVISFNLRYRSFLRIIQIDGQAEEFAMPTDVQEQKNRGAVSTQSTDFKKAMTSELTDFIQRHARAFSIADIGRLIIDLPALRKRFAKISPQRYPDLAEQLQFLSFVIEDQVVRDPAGEMVGEAAFAMTYFQRATDLIPDSIPGMGLLDDAMIVRLVLSRHQQKFKLSPQGYNLSWPTPSFDIDQLLSVISPLRLTTFCASVAKEELIAVA
jgi:uncharacterized membrane protein YkvA (DUF1232 family)